MSKTSTTDEWINATIKHLKNIPEDERYEFVHELIFHLALYGGSNFYEMIGILEMVKSELINSINETEDE